MVRRARSALVLLDRVSLHTEPHRLPYAQLAIEIWQAVFTWPAKSV